MLNLVHFQMLHTSYSSSSWLKRSSSFVLQRWSKNVYLSKGKSHLLYKDYPINPTWDWISLLLMDLIYITNTNSNDFLCSNCLFTEIRVGYFAWDSFNSILSSLSVIYQYISHLTCDFWAHHIDKYKIETQWEEVIYQYQWIAEWRLLAIFPNIYPTMPNCLLEIIFSLRSIDMEWPKALYWNYILKPKPSCRKTLRNIHEFWIVFFFVCVLISAELEFQNMSQSFFKVF